MAQWVKTPTPGFRSGHDLELGDGAVLGVCTQWGVCLKILSLCPFSDSLEHSLKKIKIFFFFFFFKKKPFRSLFQKQSLRLWPRPTKSTYLSVGPEDLYSQKIPEGDCRDHLGISGRYGIRILNAVNS